MNIEEITGKVQGAILGNRYYFMGIAMLMVVFYHWFCNYNNICLLYLFHRGYIGVDIFLFFSGLGLSYSYTQNKLYRFYRNRVIRILPIYFVWAFVHLCVICYLDNEDATPLNILGLFSTLSYYGIGQIRSNWYISALLCLYIIFPVLYKFIQKYKMWCVLFSSLGSFLLLKYASLNWYHDCFVSRFYIFILGIITYTIFNNKYNINKISRIFILVIIPIIGILSLLFSAKHQFWGISAIAPLLIIILSLFPNYIQRLNCIKLCGKYSIEIFIGNCWTMLLMSHVTFTSIMGGAIYFLSNAIFAFFLVFVNKYITDLFLNKL